MARRMKDSGVEWIGQIPEGWKVDKGKYIYNITTGKKDVNHGNPNGKYPFFTCSKKPLKINEYTFDCEALLVAGNGIVGYTQYYIGKFDAYQRTYVLYEFNMRYDNRYLLHYISSQLIRSVESKSVGSVIDFIKLSDLKNFEVASPNKIKQKAIASFLDKKTSEIDQVIEKTRESIEKYKVYKQSLITETVTKGLDSHVRMKDSGIEWIGEIPEHWDKGNIGNHFIQVKNKNIGLLEINLLSLSYGKIIKRDIDSNDGLLPENFEGYNIIEKGDIVLRMTDLQNDKVSLRTGYSNTKGIITSAYISIHNKSSYIHPKFVQLFLHSFDIYKGFYGMGSGVRQNVTFSHIKKIELIIPPLEEQKEIVSYLEHKTNEIDNIISTKEKLVEKLESYKKSLIFEYVTGKKEVI